MKNIIYLFLGLAFFTSCSAHKTLISNGAARRNNQNIQKANSAAIAAHTPLTSVQYISRYKDIAIQEMNLYAIPASITLAQGLFESGSGNSELARVANNHFGVKCNPTWTGKTYYRDDDNKNDCFRVYDSPEDSYRDHSLFLKKRNYAQLYSLDITDYKGWARGLKKAGYATNPDYPSILIGIIQKYKLDQYDSADGAAKPARNFPDTTLTKTDPDTTPPPTQDAAIPANNGSKTYTVKQGDTLYNISKRFGLTVDDLKALNNLPDNTIKIGQILSVAKQ
ncbi:MAG: glucosaminidase domain-containing protein [Sphingobacteriales bacterium]